MLGYTFALILHTNSTLAQLTDKVKIDQVTTIHQEDKLTNISKLAEFDRAIKQNPRDAINYFNRG